MTTSETRFDLIIVGGGMTGLTLACAVAGAGPRVLLIERQPLEATLTAAFDGRVTAIAQGSRRLLEALGLWSALAPDAEPIRDIRVGERASPLTVHYDHRAISDEPLGHRREPADPRGAAAARASADGGRPDARRARHGRRDPLARGRRPRPTRRRARAGRCAGAAAEGRSSPTRGAAGIEVLRWGYRQTGIVATLAHERPHWGLAVERFFPDGPCAILPMTGRRSSIVWAAHDRLAQELIGLDDDAFMDELAERVGDALGAPDAGRAALALSVGDGPGPALHRPPPGAGRRCSPCDPSARRAGLDLALRDVAALAELVVDARRLGLDPGGAAVLARYERWRRFDSRR